MTATPAADLAGNGARVVGVFAALAVIAALVAWLLAGFEAPHLSQSTTTAEPSATLSRCEFEPIGRTVPGAAGGPTGSPGRPQPLDVLAATVVVDNPTDGEVTAHLAVEFGAVTKLDFGTRRDCR